jgi:hypothetical protein
MTLDPFLRRPGRTTARCVAGAAALLLLPACVATMPTMGDSKGTVTGAAGGGTAEGKHGGLEHGDDTLGTMALQEDVDAQRR